MDKRINPIKSLKASITLPGDNAISHRAALLAALCDGPVQIKNFATGTECEITLNCLRKLGIESERDGDVLTVQGKGIGGMKQPEGPLDICGSISTARMICGILSALSFETKVVGCEAIAGLPMRRVIEPLELMGAKIESNNYKLPLTIRGDKLKGIRYAMPVSTAQVKAMLLMAGHLAEGETEVIERIPSRDHFERLLAYFGIKLKKSRVEPQPSNEDPLIKRFKKESGIVSPDIKGDMISIMGGQKLFPKPITIPGDISVASYFLVAGLLLKGSSVEVRDVDLNPRRLGFVEVLKKMKVPITVEQKGEMGFEPYGDIQIQSVEIKGRRMVGELIPSIINELPIMSIVAANAQGTSVIRDAFELRQQKVDRIKSIATNLRKMGMKVGELDDGLAIDGGGNLVGAELDSFDDPAIAMSFAVAGLLAEGTTIIKNAECVNYEYPEFWDDFDKFTAGESF
ncbi:MAG: 3-phosphoshikimate 1-carboxyvinyltransferase [Candidatus Zixiibacteriota bacterium]|nr:MAG: 3-phosphoshikimate 1-carboxyvinyltransferase [candidate division Zixibacteria bacterium]